MDGNVSNSLNFNNKGYIFDDWWPRLTMASTRTAKSCAASLCTFGQPVSRSVVRMQPLEGGMARQVWGTFSVKDHCEPRAFVKVVMNYDRLVIPVPPDDEERA